MKTWKQRSRGQFFKLTTKLTSNDIITDSNRLFVIRKNAYSVKDIK